MFSSFLCLQGAQEEKRWEEVPLEGSDPKQCCPEAMERKRTFPGTNSLLFLIVISNWILKNALKLFFFIFFSKNPGGAKALEAGKSKRTIRNNEEITKYTIYLVTVWSPLQFRKKLLLLHK